MRGNCRSRRALGGVVGLVAGTIALAPLTMSGAEASDDLEGYQGGKKNATVETQRTYDGDSQQTTFTFTLATKGENVSHVLLLTCPDVEVVSATGPAGANKEAGPPKNDPSLEHPHTGIKFEPGAPGTYTIVFAGNIAAADFVVKDGTGHKHFPSGEASEVCQEVATGTEDTTDTTSGDTTDTTSGDTTPTTGEETTPTTSDETTPTTSDETTPTTSDETTPTTSDETTPTTSDETTPTTTGDETTPTTSDETTPTTADQTTPTTTGSQPAPSGDGDAGPGTEVQGATETRDATEPGTEVLGTQESQPESQGANLPRTGPVVPPLLIPLGAVLLAAGRLVSRLGRRP